MIYIKEAEKIWYIYESETEFQAGEHAHLLRPLIAAQDGHYILVNNGYYVPIIKTGEIVRNTVWRGYQKREKRKTPIRFRYYKLPGCTRMVYKSKFDKGFTWERKYYRGGNKATVKEQAFIKIVAEGGRIMPAARAVWGEMAIPKVLESMNKEIVFKTIAERLNKMDLKKHLTEKGVDEGLIADELKKLLTGDNVQGKKYAIDKITQIMALKEGSSSGSGDGNNVLQAATELANAYGNN